MTMVPTSTAAVSRPVAARTVSHGRRHRRLEHTSPQETRKEKEDTRSIVGAARGRPKIAQRPRERRLAVCYGEGNLQSAH